MGLKTKRSPLELAQESPKSRLLAVKAKCWDCMGGDSDPNWQWRVGNCDARDCGLHGCRPYQNMEGRAVPPRLKGTGWDPEGQDVDDGKGERVVSVTALRGVERV